jgi:hypothetical protein
VQLCSRKPGFRLRQQRIRGRDSLGVFVVDWHAQHLADSLDCSRISHTL